MKFQSTVSKFFKFINRYNHNNNISSTNDVKIEPQPLLRKMFHNNIRAVPRRRDDLLHRSGGVRALHMRHAEPDSQPDFDERLFGNILGGPPAGVACTHNIIPRYT